MNDWDKLNRLLYRENLKNKIRTLEENVRTQNQIPQKENEELIELRQQYARPVSVLAIEDDPADRGILCEIFSGREKDFRIEFCSDGAGAFDRIFRRQTFRDARRPDLILLDLNLPLIDGRDLLKQIKLDSTLEHIPVLVFTTSENRADVDLCMRWGANGYIHKPSTIDKYGAVLGSIEDLWRQAVHGVPDWDGQAASYPSLAH